MQTNHNAFPAPSPRKCANLHLRPLKAALTVTLLAVITLFSGCIFGTDSSAPENPKRLFVTSSTHTGDLGGLHGADSICTARASEAALEGTWKAFLSDHTVEAVARVGKSSSWRLVDDTTEVFRGNAEFNGRPRSSIHDEHGNEVATGRAWTGTRSDGSPYENHHCSGWTSSSQQDFGAVGEPALVQQDDSPRWMNLPGTWWCASSARIYCMEQ
jgi:hypothetical protein